ncbi:MAG: hypothetical protein SFX18_01270 [Pirellulales bacterium]|nr:hypothetical protein [Pirellulales bacterium]
MPQNIGEILGQVVERTFNFVSSDPEILAQLRRIAQAFLTATEEQLAPRANGTPLASSLVSDPLAASADAATSTAAQSAVTQAQAGETAPTDKVGGPSLVAKPPANPPVPLAELPELTLGRSSQTEPARPVYNQPRDIGPELSLIEARCRLKAEAARWAFTRQRLLGEGANYATDVEPKNREIIARAKELPNCFLWMCHSSAPAPSNMSMYDEVAGCFEVVADGLALVQQLENGGETDEAALELALDLLAEAQSALRVAIQVIDGPPDTDQREVFHWLRGAATAKQIFLQKYMRLDDPADPTRWHDLQNRIGAIQQRTEQSKSSRNNCKRLLGKVRYKAGQILKNPAQAAKEWESLIATICELIQGGLAPSNRDLRELLLPIIDELPEMETYPEELSRVLAEIDRFLAVTPPPETSSPTKQSPEVQEVSRLLQGKSLVLIGGDKRQGAYQALRDDFGLRELFWIETRAHESHENFEPYVARPDVAAVLLAIRWSSHSYGEVKSFCDDYDKPLIRLPAGYNTNQVAAQIMQQASGRLQ